MADERTYIMIKCVSLSEIREIAMTRPDHPSHRSLDRSIDGAFIHYPFDADDGTGRRPNARVNE